jgi:hypothetical protein
MRITQICYLLNELGIPTIPHVLSNSQCLNESIKNRIHHETAVKHIATKNDVAANIARDGDIDLSYIPTAEILADWFTRPPQKPGVLKQCATMEMIGISIGNRLRNGDQNGIQSGTDIENTI